MILAIVEEIGGLLMLLIALAVALVAYLALKWRQRTLTSTNVLASVAILVIMIAWVAANGRFAQYGVPRIFDSNTTGHDS